MKVLIEKLDEIIKFFKKSSFPEVMDKKELARYIGIHENNVHNYIYTEGFPYLKQPGMKDGYPKQAVKKWLEEHTEYYRR
ncbi:helix-turn-helix domain-containing protein [Leuconostoc citreum]|uniref:helix-turn-helix domain-containing protein n=1 Tax=Leuconostoc citreum TaxID=33964 RepID=UPI0021824A58|nr:helix-turn-helix domain-containing protein [Leuconostoc citreum]MCS8595669.1 hypothetical protein [Leuconostoc citreum]